LTKKTLYGSSTPLYTALTWKNGFKHSIPADTGRPSYNPSDLLKLYVYGYLNQVRSSRKLEKESHRNVEVMWLMKKLAPGFKTIADFRKDNVN
jgi:transposase